jgi:hypothetical protein
MEFIFVPFPSGVRRPMIARGCRAKIERRELPMVSSNQQECLARAFGADRGLKSVTTSHHHQA